jgi:uncharacterized membrane protein YkoI
MKLIHIRGLSGRRLLVAGVAVAALAGGGAATAVAATPDDEGRHILGRVADTADDDLPDPTNARITADQAMAAALKAVPGTVGQADLDGDHDGAAWEVEILTPSAGAREVLIDAMTGAVRAQRADDDTDDLAALNSVKTRAQEAVKTAGRAAPGTVTSVELDRRHGTLVWEVEVTDRSGAERKLAMDAATGKVTADTVDRDGRHDDHDDHEDHDGDD